MVDEKRLDNILREPSVRILAAVQGVAHENLDNDTLPVYSARACFEEETALGLLVTERRRLDLPEGDSRKLTREKVEKGLEGTFRETSGRGHGAVLDQSSFAFQIEDAPRIVTLQLCQPQYLMHLQQSLRRAKADRGFYLPESIRASPFLDKVVSALDEAFALYEEMSAAGIPGEDARFVLPLYTKTNIVTTGDARELMHLHHMSRKESMPAIVRHTIDKMIEEASVIAPHLMKERANNYEPLAWLPSSQLFAPSNLTMRAMVQENGKDKARLLNYGGIQISEEGIRRAVDERDEAELANLKHLHFTFLAPMSIACLHQAIRQRTWDQSVETVYDAAARGSFVVPPSVKAREDYRSRYDIMNNKMLGLYHVLVSDGVPQQDAIGIVSHALMVYDLIHVNGWNAIHSIGKRTCTEAQWEIRAIAKEMARNIDKENPALGKYAKPQGITYGRCPEKKSCGLCTKK
jgi:thymidylate synthase (FAD)